MSIPKIIHQTWKTDEIPEVFADYVASWTGNHPNWQYQLWTDDDNRRFLLQHYSWFIQTYDSYATPIQRADAIRYFILHKFGGVYVDLDFLSCRPIDALLDGKQCVLGCEADEHARRFDMPRIICNALMATSPAHPFFEEIIHRLPDFAHQSYDDQLVLNSTGPFMLTRVYDECEFKDQMDLLPPNYLYPLSIDQADVLRQTGEVDVDYSEAYAIHFHYGSWHRPESQAELGIRPANQQSPHARILQLMYCAIALTLVVTTAAVVWFQLH